MANNSNKYTLEGTENISYEDFLLAMISNSGVATALRKDMGGEEFDTLAHNSDNFPYLYVLSLQLSSALDNTIDTHGVRYVEGFSELQANGAGQYIDIDFREGVLAKGPQIKDGIVTSINSKDFEKPEWKEFLAEHHGTMIEGIKSVVGGIVQTAPTYRDIIVHQTEVEGQSSIGEGLSHMLVGKCGSQDKGDRPDLQSLCTDFGTPKNIMLTSRLESLSAETSAQVTHP